MPDSIETALPRRVAVPSESLQAALERRIAGEVCFDAGNRAAYSTDASNYRQIPIGVVVPRTIEDVLATVEICSAREVPILLRGGGTSQNGQCTNVAVVVDTSKYLNRVIEVDPQTRTALVEPGAVCDALRDAAERHHLTFAPDPATHSRCTLGGMIGNNSCGPHSVMAGKTVENVEALEVLTYDGLRMWVGPTPDDEFTRIIAEGGRRGEIYSRLKALRDRYGELIRARFPKIKRRVSGYNLDQLLPENGFNVARALVGSEGGCALTLQAKVRLVTSPHARVLLVLGFADIYIAGDNVPEITPFGPIAMEGLDERIIGGLRARGLRLDDVKQLPEGRAWMMIEFGAETPEAAAEKARALMHHYEGKPGAPRAWLITAPVQQNQIWTIRETGASATTLALHPEQPDLAIGWEDAAVDPMRLGDYLREFQALVDRCGYKTSLYGHFGDGCIHARLNFDLRSREGIATWRGFLRDASLLVVKYGGSLSGEHGDGQAKAEFLPLLYGPELMEAFREFKNIWDPRGKMNPRKLIDPFRVEEHLRLGPDYRPAQPATHFSFITPEGNGFTRAVDHCIGMGKCRGHAGGTMCPSYRATGDERFSTRGRARLLHEMLRGEFITTGWRSDEVREALELCLSCKGCKGDCPTSTDIASLKAEFFSHYFEGRRRPRQAYTMGQIARWSRLAALAPRIINFFTQNEPFATVAKRLAGMAPQRKVPKFATKTFKQWFFRQSFPAGERPRVVLWADTFNNHFKSETAIAAAEVLEAAGYRVDVPRQALCCGRALYDYGFLDQAKLELQAILAALRPEIEAGTPIIGLEPACVTTFRDELINLFPGNAEAKKLSKQVVLFSEFLVNEARWQPQSLNVKAVVHGHCYQKAVLGMAADLKLLRLLGIDFTLLDSGCCGMSGSFGFKPENYEVSLKVARLALLPALESTPPDTLVIANGYSCREQIEQLTGRRTFHIAEAARMGVKSNAE